MVRVTGLHLYPVKSCRGLAVTSAEVDARGFVGDRRFLIVDQENQFLTQRVLPRMALVETALTAGGLELGSPGHGSIAVPLLSPLAPRPSSLSVTVWHDTVAAEDCGEEPAAWLSEFLDLTCRLVRAGSAYARPIPARKVPNGLLNGVAEGRVGSHEVSFADGFPFLVIGEESLADLNARLTEPLPMNRFRPSLVVAGAAAYAEDTWTRFRIGSVVFHGATRCGRCAITTTDQLTAERAAEPLRTLATYRRDPDGDVKFGRNLIHETKAGRVSVGAPVELL
jgi:uncharacterized protein YcbX